MSSKLISPKFLTCVMLSAAILCVIAIRKLDWRQVIHRPPPPIQLVELYHNRILNYMGYPIFQRSSKKDQDKLDHFFSSVGLFAITSSERQSSINLLEQFHAFCRKNNITYFLYYGAMLGAFRHHGLTPWDDDLDVLMPLSDKSKFQKLLKNHSVLSYGVKGTFVLPVYFRDGTKSQPIKKLKWRWPYIEVHFYEVQKDKMVHHYEKCGAHNVSDIFPLIEVPFEDMTLPAPRRMDCLVPQCYKNSETKCCTQPYSHSEEKIAQNSGICIDCKLLKAVFPFVSSRHRQGEYVIEQLDLNGTKLKTRRVKKPNCTVNTR